MYDERNDVQSDINDAQKFASDSAISAVRSIKGEIDNHKPASSEINPESFAEKANASSEAQQTSQNSFADEASQSNVEKQAQELNSNINSEKQKQAQESTAKTSPNATQASEASSFAGGANANTTASSTASTSAEGMATTAGETTAQGAGTATAASATEAGATATETGATVAEAGTATAEAGATATASTAGSTAAKSAGNPWLFIALLGASLLHKGVSKSSEEATGQSESETGLGIAGAIMIFVVLACIICLTLFGPVFMFVYKVYSAFNDAKNFIENIPAYIEEQKKEDFFEKMFPGVDIDSEINSIRSFDAESVEVCKDIIDYSIYKSLKEYTWNVLISPSANWEQFKRGFSATVTYRTLLKNPYPYALKNADGTYITVSEYLKDYTKVENNDFNYAEFFAILMQSGKFNYDSFSYSDFYDLLVNQKTTSYLIELEIGDLVYVKKEGFVSYDASMELTEEQIAAMEEDVEYVAEEEKKESWWETWWDNAWGGYDVKVYPAGLKELYSIVDASLYDEHKYSKGLTNDAMLDEQERWVRGVISGVDLGPSCEEVRSKRSNVYSLLYDMQKNQSGQVKLPSGRSAYSYCTNYLTEIAGIDYTQVYLDHRLDLYTSYIPEGTSFILDMYSYINQLTYDRYIFKRGTWNGEGTDPRSSIYDEGCIDCCYVMVYEYFYRKSLSVPEICANYVNDKRQFEWGRFMKDYGLNNHYEKLGYNEGEIKTTLCRGTPVILYYKGRWEHNGIVYHRDASSYHYIVIMGFDDKGFYVYDPANKRVTENGPIPYGAFYSVADKNFYKFDVPESCTVYFLTNPYIEGGENGEQP